MNVRIALFLCEGNGALAKKCQRAIDSEQKKFKSLGIDGITLVEKTVDIKTCCVDSLQRDVADCNCGIVYGDELSIWAHEHLTKVHFPMLLMSAAEIKGLRPNFLKAYPDASTMGLMLACLVRKLIDSFSGQIELRAFFEDNDAGHSCQKAFNEVVSFCKCSLAKYEAIRFPSRGYDSSKIVEGTGNDCRQLYVVYGFGGRTTSYGLILEELYKRRATNNRVFIVTDVNSRVIEDVTSTPDAWVGVPEEWEDDRTFFADLIVGLLKLVVKTLFFQPHGVESVDSGLKDRIIESSRFVKTSKEVMPFVDNALFVPFSFSYKESGEKKSPDDYRPQEISNDAIGLATERMRELVDYIQKLDPSGWDKELSALNFRFATTILTPCFSAKHVVVCDNELSALDGRTDVPIPDEIRNQQAILQISYLTRDFEDTNVIQLYIAEDDNCCPAFPDYDLDSMRKPSLVFARNGAGALKKYKEGVVIIGDPRSIIEELRKVYPKYRYLYYVPSSQSKKSKRYSGVLLHSDFKYRDSELTAIKNIVDSYFSAINTINYIYFIKKVSTKSAIGAIMSRNGSHNIGSHVLSALSHNVGTMPDDRVLYQYIQHRMDYIASATTGAPDWSVPTPFVGNLMKMFYSQRHLLEHIAESDGLHAYQYQGKGIQTGAGQTDCVKIIVRKIERYRAGEQPARKNGEGWLRKEREDKKNPGKKINVDAYEFFGDAPHKQKETPASKPAGDDPQSKESGNGKNGDKTKVVNWNLDEAISVPGGILGQHAFYNIVENVLRNAAKHSWAGKSEKEKEDAGNNLEIFIDFEKPTEKGLMEVEKEEGMIRFTVGDNMSKLFPGKFWEEFFKAHPKLAKDFADPLDGFIEPKEGLVPKEEQDGANQKYYSKRVCLESFLDEKEDVYEGDLPLHYQKLYKYVNDNWGEGKKLKDDKEFLSMLQGKDPNDPDTPKEQLKLGHRLPIPLHHRQEIALAKPFIDLETNRLRQAAWGLSEMKISAGYLRRADVSVIGGLKPNVGELPLIVPIGIPRSDRDEKTHQCASAEKPGELPYPDLCLAYRFWIKLPKDILIVADHVENWPKFSGDAWEGISVTSYAKVFGDGGTKGNIGLMSDYSFVLVDHNANTEDDQLKFERDQLKFPFRTLQIAENDKVMPGFPSVSAEELLGKTSKDDFVSVVYRVWLDYLKQRRGLETGHPLRIKLNIYEKDGGEKGLISDRDIYKVLFRECLHSVLEPLIEDVKLPALQRKALLLVSLYPLNEDDSLFKDVEEKVEDSHLLKMKRLLGTLSDRVWRFWASLYCSADKDCDKRKQLVNAYRVGLERAKKSMEYETLPKALLEELDACQNHAHPAGKPVLLQELNEMAENPSESSIVKLAAGALDVARTTSDVFLRKYEERIVTLPQQYKGIAKPKDPLLPFTDFGVDIAYGAAAPDRPADISYNRHSLDDAPFYSEPLSGSQSYLNALSDLSGDDMQWAMRLAENGLLRIAIIDERVFAFLSEHGDEIKNTYSAMHISVVNTEKKPDFNPEETLFPDLMKVPFVEPTVKPKTKDENFDLVIIHQGIIDKWWPNKHGQKDVAKILSSLRESGETGQSRFVVVTTGRGRPDNIPENEKILAFSAIEAFLFKRYPEKLNLVNSLMSILPGSTERNNNND